VPCPPAVPPSPHSPPVLPLPMPAQCVLACSSRRPAAATAVQRAHGLHDERMGPCNTHHHACSRCLPLAALQPT